MQLRFTKMHGLGNDFVVIDLLSQNATLTPQHIRHIADRHLGIGCDQVLLVEPPQAPDIDFNYRIFNGDGSEVEQCGNGARCFGKFVRDKKLSGKRRLAVSTQGGTITIEILDDNRVSVDMGSANFSPTALPFIADTKAEQYLVAHALGESSIGAVSIGNPHAIIQVDNIDSAPLDTVGVALATHERFPNGVNVGFMQILSRSKIALRVLERGAGETRACGSGACAAVVIGRQQGLLDETVDVALPGGQLRIHWPEKNSGITMTGDATKVYDGTIQL